MNLARLCARLKPVFLSKKGPSKARLYTKMSLSEELGTLLILDPDSLISPGKSWSTGSLRQSGSVLGLGLGPPWSDQIRIEWFRPVSVSHQSLRITSIVAVHCSACACYTVQYDRAYRYQSSAGRNFSEIF